jgi:uncharacterized protein YecE (DUF72 family)
VAVLVGTSGWQYTDWRDQLYPSGVPQRCWLKYYGQQFETVECNAAFYRLPEPHVFAHWRESTPPGFVMALKASRFLTHIRRLREPGEPVARLLDRAASLGDRLGPVLLQLPANLPADLDRLDACLACFPPGLRVAVELRHPSWWTEQTEAILRSHAAALCWADRYSRPAAPQWRTADWGYLRMHAGAAEPFPRYGRQALHTWVRRIAATWPVSEVDDPTGATAAVYVYFNNDLSGAAVADAVHLARIARHAGLPVSRVPTRIPVEQSPDRSSRPCGSAARRAPPIP